MPGAWERIKNVFTDELQPTSTRDVLKESRDEVAIRQDQTQRVAKDLQTAFLGTTLDIKNDSAKIYTRLHGSVSITEVVDHQTSKLEVRNTAFEHLRGLDSSIDTRINPYELRRSSTEELAKIRDTWDVAYVAPKQHLSHEEEAAQYLTKALNSFHGEPRPRTAHEVGSAAASYVERSHQESTGYDFKKLPAMPDIAHNLEYRSAFLHGFRQSANFYRTEEIDNNPGGKEAAAWQINRDQHVKKAVARITDQDTSAKQSISVPTEQGIAVQREAKIDAVDTKQSGKPQHIQKGYEAMHGRLALEWKEHQRYFDAGLMDPVKLARKYALEASRDIHRGKAGYSFEGTSLEETLRAEREFNTGQRRAIRAWSHETNAAVKRDALAREPYPMKALEAGRDASYYDAQEKLAAMQRPNFASPAEQRGYKEASTHVQAELEQMQYNGKSPPSADQQREGAKTVAPVSLTPGSPPQTDLPRKESSMAITTQGQDVPAERRDIDIASVSIPELKEYKQQLQDRYKEVAHERDYAKYPDVIGRNTMVTVALSDREAGRAVNANDRDTMMGTATKEALAAWQETQAQQQPKPAAQLSNAAIVTEVKELHAQFKHLSEEYKQSPTPQLREEMKPLVVRENELRQEYTVRAAQELSRDRVPADVAYSR